MHNTKLVLLLAVAFLVLIVTVVPASAAYAPSLNDFDVAMGEEDGLFANAMNRISLVFAIISAMCVVITGFFVGRKWLRNAS